ncbi:hypothetical protein D9Q98_004907 [Chlorella vulgaris]|uniref:Uncharacterized protein n=1 Tax=Chlorella vulgaris TaxID=3077 RepID=A0A9D4TNG0_CHLVU|nr:hypothetical protein D9Q98_004907 [Chlorella vulgaris]
MQQRSFQFSTLEGRTIDVNVMCHAPPEAVAHKTLTLRETLQNQQHQGAEHHAAPGGKPDKLPPQSAPDLIGLDIWPASIALCRYLAAHPYLVVGQHVLELGAGMGLPGLLSASLGAASALLTDYEPAVLTQLVENAMLNSVQQRCSSQLVDFCCPVAGLRPEQQGSWRLVLVADVLYAERIAQPLAQTLKLALHPEGVALVGHQVRRAVYLDPATRLPCLEPEDGALEAFKQCCAGCGLQLRMLSSLPTCSTVDSDPMVLLAIGPGRAALELLPGAASAPLGLTAATLP